MKKSIPPNLEDEILKKIGENWSPQKIADWLGTEHQVETSRAAVQRLVQRRAKERAPITQAVVREQLAPKVTADLDGFDQLLADEVHIQQRIGDLDKQVTQLETLAAVDITKAYGENGQILPMDDWPADLKYAAKKIKSEQLFDGSGDGKYRSGDTVELETHDKLRAIDLIVSIRREASEHRRKLLEVRLKLAGASGGDTDAVRERLLAAFEDDDKKD